MIIGRQWVEFLKADAAPNQGQVADLLGGLPGHRSRLERAYVESLDSWIVLERVPAVTPVHNHVDY